MESLKTLKDLFKSKHNNFQHDKEPVKPNIELVYTDDTLRGISESEETSINSDVEVDSGIRNTVTIYKGFNVELLQNLCQNNQIDQIRRFISKNNDALIKYEVKDLNADFKLNDLKFYKKNGKIILSKNYYKNKMESINKKESLIDKLENVVQRQQNEVEQLRKQIEYQQETINKIVDVISNKLPIILSEIEERCCSSSGISHYDRTSSSPKGPSYHK